MARYVAFLRAINVGGHVVRMEQLRRVFEALGFADVETFIASGNVLFSTSETDEPALERRIEASLEEALGYPVATFVRTAAALKAVAAFQPFSPDPAAEGGAIYIMFFAKPLSAAARKQVMAWQGEADGFAVRGREIYWCRRGSLLDSPISGAATNKMIAGLTTMRNRNTIVRLVKRLEK